ncbi:MAG: permease [Hyphomicrobiales bacterium]|nr:permease [Hyphomicrobiales bacterium]
MYSHTVFEMFNRMWWGLLLGIMFVGMLSKVPKAFVLAIIGAAGTKQGILRATLAGILLDLCSHGILLVGMKLYERGAGLGQVVAFLVASPWNSFSLTLILISLIGWQWTGFFIVASAVIAIVSGMLFDLCVRKGILPQNPNAVHDDIDFHFLSEMKKGLARTQFNTKLFSDMARSGIAESRMILKWIFLGVIIAGLMRTFTDPSQFQSLFGPTLAGLGLTLVAATIIEVCSEGAVPIAADILTRAHAPGNAFAFLMAGVATDYTEIMGLKERTKSWKIALFLPLISLPQVILVSWLINVYN